MVFELFFQSEEIVETFSTLAGKIKFFETAVRRDSNNVLCFNTFLGCCCSRRAQTSH